VGRSAADAPKSTGVLVRPHASLQVGSSRACGSPADEHDLYGSVAR
jgi:hypothetical protein